MILQTCDSKVIWYKCQASQVEQVLKLLGPESTQVQVTMTHVHISVVKEQEKIMTDVVVCIQLMITEKKKKTFPF